MVHRHGCRLRNKHYPGVRLPRHRHFVMLFNVYVHALTRNYFCSIKLQHNFSVFFRGGDVPAEKKKLKCSIYNKKIYFIYVMDYLTWIIIEGNRKRKRSKCFLGSDYKAIFIYGLMVSVCQHLLYEVFCFVI